MGCVGSGAKTEGFRILYRTWFPRFPSYGVGTVFESIDALVLRMACEFLFLGHDIPLVPQITSIQHNPTGGHPANIDPGGESLANERAECIILYYIGKPTYQAMATEQQAFGPPARQLENSAASHVV